MYVILADFNASGTWENLFYQGDSDYAAHDIECSLQMGDSGSLKLTVPPTNPNVGRVVTRKTLLDFRLDDKSLGIFEIREVSHDIMGNAELYAVGELAWLFDSVQPQAEFHDVTVRGFLSTLLNVHNAQCPEHAFEVGIVNVEDSNDSLYRYTNREQTLDCIRDKLVDRLGGCLRVRKANGRRYLDYVTEQTYGVEAEQDVRFGENILDYSDNYTVDEICSEVVPLGARLGNDKGDNSSIGNLEKRVTVEDVNGGRDYVSNDALVSRFGHIRTTHTWDDVTIPANLLAKAEQWLADGQYEKMHITVSAVDLSLSDSQFGAFRMGDRAYVVSEPLGMKRIFTIRARTYHPYDPTQDSIELGDKLSTSFVASQVRSTTETDARAKEQEHTQTQWLTEAIGNVTAMMTGSRGGYKLTEYDDEGRWLADYIMDSMDKETAQIVRKTTLDGTAYSRTGVNGPYDTAIMANGTIVGKYIQANSVTAEQISQSYTTQWMEADNETLSQARTEFQAADDSISARVSKTESDVRGVKTDLEAEVRIRADEISQTVKKGQIGSAINQSAEKITITANKFGWTSTNSSLTTDGTLTAKNASFENCSVSGTLLSENYVGRVRLVSGELELTQKLSGREYVAGWLSSQSAFDWVENSRRGYLSLVSYNKLNNVGVSENYVYARAQTQKYGTNQATNSDSATTLQMRSNYFSAQLSTYRNGTRRTEGLSVEHQHVTLDCVSDSGGYSSVSMSHANLYLNGTTINLSGRVNITGTLYLNGRQITA